jgi:hypothetical protein
VTANADAEPSENSRNCPPPRGKKIDISRIMSVS